MYTCRSFSSTDIRFLVGGLSLIYQEKLGSHTQSHTHTHTRFHVIWGCSIGIMVFLLYKLYFISPYTETYPLQETFLDFQKKYFCMIYKLLSSKIPPQGQKLPVLLSLWTPHIVINNRYTHVNCVILLLILLLLLFLILLFFHSVENQTVRKWHIHLIWVKHLWKQIQKIPSY